MQAEDKKSSTMLWVQASAGTLHQDTPPEGQEWFYIPRPSLHTGTRRSSSEGSRYSGSSSAARRAGTKERGVRNCLSLVHEQPTPACTDPPGVHGVPSSASSASSQVSAGSSGQLLVDCRPSWLPAHPPPLQVVPKDGFAKQDPESGGSDRSPGDGDNISLASSTHFTVVGTGAIRRRSGGCCCSQSHRLTVLVLTMSLIFLAGILTAVFLLEMRFQHRR